MTHRRNAKLPTALVIGATGGIGGETAKALVRRGWRVRALTRDRDAARHKARWIGAVEWVVGDAMHEADMAAAAQGAAVIVHGANPPKYRNWRGLALPMLANAIAAARSSGARLVLPGNIYNFGPDAWPVLAESSPQTPETRKGAVRVEMENLLAAAADDGVRGMVVRAGDYFGPNQPASWVRDVMISPGKPVTSITYPGAHDVGHAWAYLPDVAEAMVRLIEIEGELPEFDVFHFAGHWLEDGVEMARALARVAGVPDARIRRLPWALLRLASPFSPLLREILEMRYLWQVPVRLDNAKLVARIGAEPHTPLDAALRDTLDPLGCLPQANAKVAHIAQF
jgi:nucleoside-diphosphate-sugar epimerase